MPFQSTRRDVAAARPIREDVNDGLRDKVLFPLLRAGRLPAFGFRLVVTLGVIVLWRLRSHRAVLLAAAMLAAVFAVIVSDEPGGSGA